jgi:hypothetical protein
MNITIRALVPGALLAIMLVGCHQSTPPAAKLTLPTLDRPLSITKFKNNSRIMVPASNVIKRGGITGVFILQNKLARFRMIKTGKLVVNHIEILSGFDGSETLVGGDLSSVHDGSPINLI